MDNVVILYICKHPVGYLSVDYFFYRVRNWYFFEFLLFIDRLISTSFPWPLWMFGTR